MTNALLIATLLLGCGGSNEDLCSWTVNATIDGMITSKIGSDGTIAPDRKQRMDKLRDVLTTRCKADTWSPEMLACVKTVQAQPDLMRCQSAHLDAAAQQRLQGDIMGVMAGGRPAGGPPMGGSSHAP